HQARFHQHGIFVIREHCRQTTSIIARPSKTKPRRNLSGNSPSLQILDSRARMLQIRDIMSPRGFEDTLMPRNFLTALPLLLTLARSARSLGNREAYLSGKRAHRLREARPGVLSEKGDCSTVGATAETMIKLPRRTNGERRGFFFVEWAETEKVRSALAQLHIAPDDINDVDPGEQILYEGFWYQSIRVATAINTGAEAVAGCGCAYSG